MQNSEETQWDIPLGPVKIELLDTEAIEQNSMYHESEHCLEVQLPFLSVVQPNATLTPLLLAGPTSSAESYAKKLTPFDTQGTLWVISSDFNHVGPNFQHNPREFGYSSGEAMDLEAIDYITSGDIAGFSTFLKKTKATICGALSILVAMHLIKQMRLPNLKF